MFAALFCAPALAHAAADTNRGTQLVRIEVESAASIDALVDAGIEPWSDHPRPPSMLARVPAEARAWLDASGRTYEVVVPDLSLVAKAERERLHARPPAAGTAATFEWFRDLPEIESHMDALAQLDPELASPVQIGSSLEGRPIRGLRIEREADEPKPLVVVNATQHAREWIAAMSTLFVADALVTTAQTDPVVDALLDEVAVLVVPVSNPDGYVYTWEEDRFWRKNRRDGQGVDLNRNFAIAWGGEGSSGNPEHGNYHGAAPLSEPEAAALAGLLDAEPMLVAVLDVHSFGQLVLAPWSFTLDPPPADDELAPLGEAIAEWMGEPWQTEYTPQQAAELYLAAGTWPDQAYGTRGSWAYTLELRPEDAEPFAQGFVQPAEAIVPCGEEVLAALVVLAEHAASEGALAPGDDGDAPEPTEPEPDPEATGGSSSDASTGDASTSHAGGTDARDPTSTGSIGTSTGDGTTTDAPAFGSQIDAVRSSCACRPGPCDAPPWGWLLLVIAGARPRARAAARLVAR